MIFSDSRRPYLNKFFKKIKRKDSRHKEKNSCCEKQNAANVLLDFSNRSLKWDSNESAKFRKRQVCLSRRREIQICLFALYLNKLKLFVNFFFARNSSRKVRFLKIRLNFCQSQLFLNKKSCRWAENFTCVVKLLLNSSRAPLRVHVS